MDEAEFKDQIPEILLLCGHYTKFSLIEIPAALTCACSLSLLFIVQN